MYIPPRGGDSDLRARGVRSHCARPAVTARCAHSLHIWFSQQDLTGFKLQNPKTTCVTHNTFPAKLDVHNRSHEFWIAAFYLANKGVQIRKSIPEQPEHTSPWRDHLAADLLVVQHRGSCSHFPAMLSPPPKINGGDRHPRENCWFRSPHTAPPATAATACATTKWPVLQQRSQDPAPLLRAAQKSPLKSRNLPPLTLPLLPAPHHNTCHASLHRPGQEGPMQPMTTTNGGHTAATGTARQARAGPHTPYTPQGKPAADTHALQITVDN